MNRFKKLTAVFAAFLLFISIVSIVNAAPNNLKKAENNPQVVAYYPEGIHAIPTDPITYVDGTSLVMTRGNTGQIEAWYTGSDGHGYHSVWNVAKNSTCSANQVLVLDAFPSWGDYLTPDTDYCVKVNAF